MTTYRQSAIAAQSLFFEPLYRFPLLLRIPIFILEQTNPQRKHLEMFSSLLHEPGDEDYLYLRFFVQVQIENQQLSSPESQIAFRGFAPSPGLVRKNMIWNFGYSEEEIVNSVKELARLQQKSKQTGTFQLVKIIDFISPDFDDVITIEGRKCTVRYGEIGVPALPGTIQGEGQVYYQSADWQLSFSEYKSRLV